MKIRIMYCLAAVMMVALLAACSFCPHSLDKADPAGNIEIPEIFGSHMVLQQDRFIPVWGQAEPGGRVNVTLGKVKGQALTGTDGRWQVNLPPVKAGGPYDMTIAGFDTIVFHDVLIGEVWICSGQSNMEFAVSSAASAAEAIETAHYDNIRLFNVNNSYAWKPLDDVNSDGWQVCSPTSVRSFSAVGYFFGRELYNELDCPVGLIHTSWGGTPAEAWTSSEALKTLPDFKAYIEYLEAGAADSLEKTMYAEENAFDKQVQIWKEAMDGVDQGLLQEPEWSDPSIDTEKWNKMEIPCLWEGGGLPGYDGSVWFRKVFKLEEIDRNKTYQLHIGPVDDIDYTWLNGVLLGSEDVYNAARIYEIPEGVLKAGRNVIAVRVLDYMGGGGLWGSADQLKLADSEGAVCSLAGTWLYKVGVDTMKTPQSLEFPKQIYQEPTVLFNAMISPLVPYGIRGAIWYQGENNAGQAYQYRTLFPAMIRDWRKHWNSDFPFYYVQLTNYMQVNDKPEESDWAELREAQLMTLAEPNVGMAIIIDLGEADDIHPKNKVDVARRLALNALALTYGKDVPFSGPIMKFMTIENSQIRLTFRYTDRGLVAKGGALKGFSIAGVDRKFVWADAVIEGETVVVSSPQVPEPVAVRYAWANNPVCNLYNGAGLPASPFRTDDWPGVTEP